MVCENNPFTVIGVIEYSYFHKDKLSKVTMRKKNVKIFEKLSLSLWTEPLDVMMSLLGFGYIIVWYRIISHSSLNISYSTFSKKKTANIFTGSPYFAVDSSKKKNWT